VNALSTDDKERLSALLSRFPPEIVARAEQCLDKLLRLVPCSHVIVYEYPASVVATLGMSERGYEGLASLAVAPEGVKFYLDRSLPDPMRLLKGAGSKVRSLDLAAASRLDDDEVRALIDAALARAGGASAMAGAPQVVFKSDAKKPKATKARDG
jgi:hypothetical protein